MQKELFVKTEKDIYDWFNVREVESDVFLRPQAFKIKKIVRSFQLAIF